MHVRVTFTVDISDEGREAINDYLGRSGLASRQQVKQFFEDEGLSGISILNEQIYIKNYGTMTEISIQNEQIGTMIE